MNGAKTQAHIETIDVKASSVSELLAIMFMVSRLTPVFFICSLGHYNIKKPHADWLILKIIV